jgi:hypothetical protein
MSHDDDPRWKYKLERIRRTSHRLGLAVATIIVVSGLLLMAMDAVGLRLGDLTSSDIPILARGIGIALTGIGLVAVAAYGIVRAIGWSISRSI